MLKLGLKAVPHMLPHLSDMRMTQSFRVHGSGQTAQISVNEILGHVITRLCGHYFYISSGDNVVEWLGDKPIKNPETITLYQKQVEKWYSTYGHWTESERKILDVEDGFHYNRFNAYKFFAKNPSPKALPRLRAKMWLLLTDPRRSSMTVSELVSCSESLSSAGDRDDLDLIKRVWMDLYEYPMNTSERENNVKRLFHFRKNLGDREAALKDIKLYNQKHADKYPSINLMGLEGH